MASVEDVRSSYQDEDTSRADSRSTRGGLPSDSVAPSRTQRHTPRGEAEEHLNEQASRSSRSVISRRDLADRSNAQAGTGSSAAGVRATYDYEPVGVAASSSGMDVETRQKLSQLGEVEPGDSVSATGKSHASRSVKDGSHARRGARTTVAARNQSEMPAEMANVGKKAEVELGQEKDAAKHKTELGAEEPDVTGLEAEIQAFVGKVTRDIAQGFGNDNRVRNAWLDEVITEVEEIRTRLNELPKNKTQACTILLDQADTLLREQAEICYANTPAVKAALKGKSSEQKLPDEPPERPKSKHLGHDTHHASGRSETQTAEQSDDDANDSISPSHATTNKFSHREATSRVGKSDAAAKRNMPDHVHHKGKDGGSFYWIASRF